MNKYILAVDDDPDVLALVKLALKHEGFDIGTASNGKEALAAAAARTPDVIILDVMMPEMNGADLTRALKAQPDTAATPIIMLTGLSEKKYVKAALFDLGVDFYVTKPFDPEDLIDKVQQAIQYRRAE